MWALRAVGISVGDVDDNHLPVNKRTSFGDFSTDVWIEYTQ